MDYDPLLAKLIAWGNSREEAIARLRRALKEYAVAGIKSNAALFRRILAEPDFLRADIHTKWLDELLLRPPAPANNLTAHFSAQEQRNSAAEASVIVAALWQAKQSSCLSHSTEDSASPSRWKLDGRLHQLDRTP
jgi:acetyl/propionyl-CoA carboxylase alpha subunit